MTPFTRGFADEFLKLAARRGLKLVRDLLEGGKLEEAKAWMARNSASLRREGDVQRLGSEIKVLNKSPSSEGPAVLMVHPDRGIHVSKFYDKRSPVHREFPQTIERKEQLARVDDPLNTKLIGKSSFKGQHRPVHHFEYAEGKTLADRMMELGATRDAHGRIIPTTPASRNLHQRFLEEEHRFRRAARKAGLGFGDTHAKNVVVTPSGGFKIIDSIPHRLSEPAPRLGVTNPNVVDPRESYHRMAREISNASGDARQAAAEAKEELTASAERRTPARGQGHAVRIPLRPAGAF